MAAEGAAMYVTVRGKRWRLKFGRLKPTADYHGICDAPSTPAKTITVNSRLRGEKRLEVLIHELLHAGHWDWDEEAVEEFARDLARVLVRLGYGCHESNGHPND